MPSIIVPKWISPLILSARNVPVLTSGAPDDIAEIQIPAGITRWMLQSLYFAWQDATVLVGSSLYVESGDSAEAVFQLRSAAGGAGDALNDTTYGQPVTGAAPIMATTSNNILVSTARKIFVRQTSDSLAPSVCSFHITIFPLR